MSVTKVIKRNDSEQEFCLDKIIKAVKSANNSVAKEDQMNEEAIQKVINTVQKSLEGFNSINVEDIQDLVEKALVRHNKYVVSKSYILYRQKKKESKKFTENEEKVLSLIGGNSELRGDNANKNIDDNGSMRDYFAGILSKSLTNKMLPKEITNAHKKGLIHFHDADYHINPMHNCLHRDTKFITSNGVRTFNDFNDGDEITVLTKDGNWRKAVVKCYGEGDLFKYTFYNGKKCLTQTVIATENHRWYLKDGSITTELKIGDSIVKPPFIYNQDEDYETYDEIQKILWCKGFGIGDGTVEYNTDGTKSNRTRIRLCGEKDNKWLNRFNNKECTIREQKIGNDRIVSILNYTKTIPEFRNVNDVKAFVNGLYCADGKMAINNPISRTYRIQSSHKEVIDFIREYAPICGLYITRELDLTGEKTNFIESRPYTILFSFNPCQKKNYKVLNKEYYGKDETWCLEVEEEHNFVLSNGIVTGNCDLLNIEDMFENGFQMQNTKIEPNSGTPFRTACNLLAQINLIVSGRQYGGQTVSWSHLLPFIDYSRKIIRKQVETDFAEEGITLSEEKLNEKVEKKLRDEIYEGVKTYQYQILCHSSSNGQTPFVSNNICLCEAQTQRELDDFAILIEEILKRRIKGVKDQSGHYITPLFPKLLYWMSDGLNLNETDPYFNVTEIAAECEAKRMQPDINSEKECRKVKKGQIIPSMGCRSWLSPIWEDVEYQIDAKFYWTKGDERGEYPYGTFVDKKSFDEIENGDFVVPCEDDYTWENGYGYADYVINFRGNTGWLLKKTDTTVVIRQPKIYGRWNNGVVTINLPHVALEAREAEEDLEARMFKFKELLSERLELCRKALKIRYQHSCEIKAKNSSILWMYGALARMNGEQTVGELMKMYPKRASISLGFVGLYETCFALIGESNTTEAGQELSINILKYINEKLNEWKEEDHMNYSLYGTPEESLTYKFSLANRRDFGYIDFITDKDYVVNSYHVDPREHIDAFTKLEIEGKYLALSSGGAVSYVETGDLTKNPEAIITIFKWMYDHIAYAEVNRIVGICYECGHDGEMKLVQTEDGKFKFVCPVCGNSDDNKMDVRGRLCGYLGTINAGNTNFGRLFDIFSRVWHLDCKDEVQ